MKKTITITLTLAEAEWLRNALSVASSAFAQGSDGPMSRWTMGMAKGIDSKIDKVKGNP